MVNIKKFSDKDVENRATAISRSVLIGRRKSQFGQARMLGTLVTVNNSETMMSEQIAERESPSAEQNAHATSQGSETQAAPSSSESHVSHDPARKELNDAFAGVKKSALEKGYSIGYQKALEEARAEQEAKQSQYSQGKTDNYQPSQKSAQPSQNANNSQPRSLTGEDFDKLYQEKRQKEEQEEQERRFVEKDRMMLKEGPKRYEDFNDKVESFGKKMQQEAQSGNHELFALAKEAYELDDPTDILYTLSTNEKAVEKILEKNPRLWKNELKKLASANERKDILKLAPDPLDDVKSPPANGGGSMTMKDKVARMREASARQ